MSINSRINEIITYLKINRNISQKEIAGELDISVRTLQRLITENTKIDEKYIILSL